jgi:hypothetical protein
MALLNLLPFVFVEANISSWLWIIAFVLLIVWMAHLDD